MSDIPVQSASAHGAHEAEEFPDDFFNEPQSFDQSQSSDQSQSFDRPQDATAEIEPASAVDLDSDPFADDLSKELAHAAPKTWFNRTTVIIGGLALIVGGFLGGIQVEKNYGSSSSNNAAAAIANARSQFARGGTGTGARGEGGTGGFPGFGGGGTGGGGASSAAAAQTGTVKLVDGTTIYVTLSDGTVLTVKTSGSTKVTTASTTKLSALKVGETVTIAGGTPDSTGNMTATSVTATSK